MTKAARLAIAVTLLGLLFASGVALLHTGVYGLTIFLVHPMLLGALAAWAFPTQTGWGAAGRGALAVLVAAGVLFASGLEGAGCLLVALPLMAPLGALGGWVARSILSSKAFARGGMAMLLILPPATLAFDTHAQSPVYAVRTTIEIAASPDQVWRHIAAIPQMAEPREWYFRTGLAYPKMARIDGAGVGATRICEFSTGQVVESIEVWDAPRRLRFRVTENPAPMREWTPYREVSPKHLHGYLISREGEFRLTPLAGQRTLLEGTSWYSHGLWPAQYWRLWSDAVYHRIHLRVFNQIKLLAEADAHR